MTFNAMTERYEEITVCGKPALFTSIRIKRDTIPDGLYLHPKATQMIEAFDKANQLVNDEVLTTTKA